MAAVDAALQGLMLIEYRLTPRRRRADARSIDQRLIGQRLRNAEAWNRDERLIIFTEYKTTLRLSRISSGVRIWQRYRIHR